MTQTPILEAFVKKVERHSPGGSASKITLVLCAVDRMQLTAAETSTTNDLRQDFIPCMLARSETHESTLDFSLRTLIRIRPTR